MLLQHEKQPRLGWQFISLLSSSITGHANNEWAMKWNWGWTLCAALPSPSKIYPHSSLARFQLVSPSSLLFLFLELAHYMSKASLLSSVSYLYVPSLLTSLNIANFQSKRELAAIRRQGSKLEALTLDVRFQFYFSFCFFSSSLHFDQQPVAVASQFLQL